MYFKKKSYAFFIFLFILIQFTCSDKQLHNIEYHNLFTELLGKSNKEVKDKINTAWGHLFYGDNDMQRVYYPVDDDMAYIMDIGNGDVRSEGMSYGMMIAVQLDKKEEFDRLWKWAKTYMYQDNGPIKVILLGIVLQMEKRFMKILHQMEKSGSLQHCSLQKPVGEMVKEYIIIVKRQIKFLILCYIKIDPEVMLQLRCLIRNLIRLFLYLLKAKLLNLLILHIIFLIFMNFGGDVQ